MKKYKYRFGNGLGDFKGEHLDIKMLEEFAALGYHPIKVSNWGYYKFKFEKSEVCSYSIDVVEIKKDSTEFENYKAFFASAGWEYVLSYYDFHYFKAPKGTNPIYSDTKSATAKYENISKSLLRLVMLATIMTLLFVGLAFVVNLRWLTIIFSIVAAGSGGATIAIISMAISNRKRIARFNKGLNLNEKEAKILMSLEVTAQSVQDYEQLSKVYKKKCLISFAVVVISQGMMILLSILDFGQRGIISVVFSLSLNGLFGALIGGFLVFGLQNLFSFIRSRKQAMGFSKNR